MNKFTGKISNQKTSVWTGIKIISWSLLMVLVGIGLGKTTDTISMPFLGFSQLTASPQHSTDLQIVRMDRNRLSGNNLGDFAPYEPDYGDLVARGHEYFYSKDGNFGIGVWESKPGKMTYTDLEYDELMYVLEGNIVMTDKNGKIESYGPGEGLVLPKGWSGTLAVPEGGVRKIWVSYMAGTKGSQ